MDQKLPYFRNADGTITAKNAVTGPNRGLVTLLLIPPNCWRLKKFRNSARNWMRYFSATVWFFCRPTSSLMTPKLRAPLTREAELPRVRGAGSETRDLFRYVFWAEDRIHSFAGVAPQRLAAPERKLVDRISLEHVGDVMLGNRFFELQVVVTERPARRASNHGSLHVGHGLRPNVAGVRDEAPVELPVHRDLQRVVAGEAERRASAGHQL